MTHALVRADSVDARVTTHHAAVQCVIVAFVDVGDAVSTSERRRAFTAVVVQAIDTRRAVCTRIRRAVVDRISTRVALCPKRTFAAKPSVFAINATRAAIQTRVAMAVVLTFTDPIVNTLKNKEKK